MRVLRAVRQGPVPVRVAAGALLALAVGLGLQALVVPDPRPGVLQDLRGTVGYLGQAAAPYLLVPFAVGLLSRTRAGAAVGGVLSCWILVAAYYGWFIPGTLAAAHGGVREQAVWLIAATGAGTVSGLIAQAALHAHPARLLMPAALVLEPIGWWVLLEAGIAPVLAQPQHVVGALVEAAIGLLWMALLVRRRSAEHPRAALPRRAGA